MASKKYTNGIKQFFTKNVPTIHGLLIVALFAIASGRILLVLAEAQP